MAIIGFNDTPRLRRNGKIRAGYKDEKTNKLMNTDYFLLHDAPGVAESIGDKPTEIYFTVYTDNVPDVCHTDLRLYNANQLLCRSMHNAPDENGVVMGAVAAYYGLGLDVKGLQQRPFPRLTDARVRHCQYKSCPEYVQGKCGEHMFFNFMIPQHSMGELFTLDSVSVNAILNAEDVLWKAKLRYGRISGQIFKMYKAPGEISYQKKDGSKGKSEAQMVSFSIVDFDEYEQKFRNQIRSDDWDALMNIRSPGYILGTTSFEITGPTREELTGGQTPQIAAPAQSANQQLIDDQDAGRARAMDPILTPYFEELGALLGKEPSEKIRIATAAPFTSVAAVLEYLQKKIKEAKKKAGVAQVENPPPPVEQPPVDVPPPHVEGSGNSIY